MERMSDHALAVQQQRSVPGIIVLVLAEVVVPLHTPQAMSADEEERMCGGRRRSSESISSARRSTRGSSWSLSPDVAEAPAPIPASPGVWTVGRIKILI